MHGLALCPPPPPGKNCGSLDPLETAQTQPQESDQRPRLRLAPGARDGHRSTPVVHALLSRLRRGDIVPWSPPLLMVRLHPPPPPPAARSFCPVDVWFPYASLAVGGFQGGQGNASFLSGAVQKRPLRIAINSANGSRGAVGGQLRGDQQWLLVSQCSCEVQAQQEPGSVLVLLHPGQATTLHSDPLLRNSGLGSKGPSLTRVPCIDGS